MQEKNTSQSRRKTGAPEAKRLCPPSRFIRRVSRKRPLPLAKAYEKSQPANVPESSGKRRRRRWAVQVSEPLFLSCLGFRLWVAKKDRRSATTGLQRRHTCFGRRPLPLRRVASGHESVRRQTTASGQNNRESAVKTCLSAASLLAPFERKSGGKFPQDRQGKCRARKPPGFCTCQLTAAGACRTSSLLQSLCVRLRV